MEFSSIDEILDYAIASEQEAVRFYTELAERASNPQTRKVFLLYAGEERGHEEKLKGIKSSGIMKKSARPVETLNLADYTVDVDVTGDLDYQDALIIAMKREKAAFRLYSDLADRMDDESTRELFLALAQEEAKHKLRFELEYDQRILTDN